MLELKILNQVLENRPEVLSSYFLDQHYFNLLNIYIRLLTLKYVHFKF